MPFEVHVKVRDDTRQFKGHWSRAGSGNVHEFDLEAPAKSASAASTPELRKSGVIKIDKTTGVIVSFMDAGSSVPSVTTSSDASLTFAAISGATKCFDGEAEKWVLSTGHGSAMSMQYVADAAKSRLLFNYLNKIDST